MKPLKPLQIVRAVKSVLGEKDWASSADDDYNLYSEEEVVEAINVALQEIYATFEEQFAPLFITYEDITVGSTQEHTLAEQDKFYGIVRVEDENQNHIERIDYHHADEYDDLGQQAWWFREDRTNGHTIGVVRPDDITTIRVWYATRPRHIIGGMGVTVVGADSTASAPYWADPTNGYYAVTNYVETVQIANHKLSNSSRRRDAVLTFDGSILTWDDGSANTGDNVFWCVEPEFAPPAALKLVVLMAKKFLKEGQEGEVSAALDRRIELEKQRFMGSFTDGGVRSLDPEIIHDWMG
ncbi:MAG: hypothetical protein IMY80_05205 [Chloroflexi bacterium]|nr:hypothetical protein [Chloroflexota bacterium]